MDPLPIDLLRLKNIQETSPLISSLEEFPPMALPKETASITVFDRAISLLRTVFGAVPEPKETARHIVQINKEASLDEVDLIISTLNGEKEALLAEFQAQVKPFIKRILDPIADDALRLKQKLQDKQFEGMRWLKATADVELLLRYSKPEQILEKIVSSAFRYERDAIARDLLTLLSCQSEVVGSIVDPVLRQEVLQELEQKLMPTYDRIGALVEKPPDLSTVKELYLWKISVDNTRYALTERGLLMVDALIKSKGLKPHEPLINLYEAEESLIHPDETRLQELQDASQRFLVAFSSYSLENEWEEALFIMRQLREEVLEIDPHALQRKELKDLFEEILHLILKAEDLIRP